jgi:hypothetical protein
MVSWPYKSTEKHKHSGMRKNSFDTQQQDDLAGKLRNRTAVYRHGAKYSATLCAVSKLSKSGLLLGSSYLSIVL